MKMVYLCFMGAIFLVDWLKSLGFILEKKNKSPYALAFQFYVTLDDLEGSLSERSIGFFIFPSGVVIDEDLQLAAVKDRWIGRSIQQMIQVYRSSGPTVIGTAPPEHLRGKEIDLEDVPLLQKLFGAKVDFHDHFPDLVSTTFQDYTTDDVETQISYDQDMLDNVGKKKLVALYGKRQSIIGRIPDLTTFSILNGTGTVVVDNGFGVGDSKLWYSMVHGGYDEHHAPEILRKILLPALRWTDVFGLSWLHHLVSKSSNPDLVKKEYDESDFRWMQQNVAAEVCRVGGFPLETSPGDLFLISLVYSLTQDVQVSTTRSTNAFIEVLSSRQTSTMKSVNRALYYCHTLEPTFGSMKPAQKAAVFQRVQKADNHSSSLARLNNDLEMVVWFFGHDVEKLVKDIGYLFRSLPGPDGIEKMQHILACLMDPQEFALVKREKGAALNFGKTEEEISAKSTKNREAGLTPFNQEVEALNKTGFKPKNDKKDVVGKLAKKYNKTREEVIKALNNKRYQEAKKAEVTPEMEAAAARKLAYKEELTRIAQTKNQIDRRDDPDVAMLEKKHKEHGRRKIVDDLRRTIAAVKKSLDDEGSSESVKASTPKANGSKKDGNQVGVLNLTASTENKEKSGVKSDEKAGKTMEKNNGKNIKRKREDDPPKDSKKSKK